MNFQDPYLLCFLPALIIYGLAWYEALKKRGSYFSEIWILLNVVIITVCLFFIGLIHFIK